MWLRWAVTAYVGRDSGYFIGDRHSVHVRGRRIRNIQGCLLFVNDTAEGEMVLSLSLLL